MTLRRLNARAPRRGQSAVEFALIFPIFILLITLLIDLGTYYYIESTMSHAVRMTLRDAVVGKHHQNLTSGQTPRAKLISLLKQYIGPGAGLVKVTATNASTGGNDTLTITPANCYNSDEYITIEMRQNHKFITPVANIIKYFNPASTTTGNWNIVVRTTYRSENFQENSTYAP